MRGVELDGDAQRTLRALARGDERCRVGKLRVGRSRVASCARLSRRRRGGGSRRARGIVEGHTSRQRVECERLATLLRFVQQEVIRQNDGTAEWVRHGAKPVARARQLFPLPDDRAPLGVEVYTDGGEDAGIVHQRHPRRPRGLAFVKQENHGFAVSVEERRVPHAARREIGDEVHDERFPHARRGPLPPPVPVVVRPVPVRVRVHRGAQRQPGSTLRSEQHRRAPSLRVGDGEGGHGRDAKRGWDAAGAHRGLPRVQGRRHDGHLARVPLDHAELALANGDEQRVPLVPRRPGSPAHDRDGSDGAVEVELGDDLEGHLRVVGLVVVVVPIGARGFLLLGHRHSLGAKRGVARSVRRGIASDCKHREMVRLHHHQVRGTAVTDGVGEIRSDRVVHASGRVDLLVNGKTHRRDYGRRPPGSCSRPEK